MRNCQSFELICTINIGALTFKVYYLYNIDFIMSLIYRDISSVNFGKNLNEHLNQFQIEKHKSSCNTLRISAL